MKLKKKKKIAIDEFSHLSMFMCKILTGLSSKYIKFCFLI